MRESLKKIKKNRGMSYVELIVVLSIFSVMGAVVLYNYGGFQGKVDIKNLASDIALKIVEAQKSSLSGKLPPAAQLSQTSLTWRPSYGVFIGPSVDNKSFYYFTDIDGLGTFSDTACAGNGECLQKITLTKGNTISSLNVFYSGDITPYSLHDLTISFTRPNSSAVIKSTTLFSGSPSYVQVNISSPKGPTAKIKIYPSGRIQVN